MHTLALLILCAGNWQFEKQMDPRVNEYNWIASLLSTNHRAVLEVECMRGIWMVKLKGAFNPSREVIRVSLNGGFEKKVEARISENGRRMIFEGLRDVLTMETFSVEQAGRTYVWEGVNRLLTRKPFPATCETLPFLPLEPSRFDARHPRKWVDAVRGGWGSIDQIGDTYRFEGVQPLTEVQQWLTASGLPGDPAASSDHASVRFTTVTYASRVYVTEMVLEIRRH